MGVSVWDGISLDEMVRDEERVLRRGRINLRSFDIRKELSPDIWHPDGTIRGEVRESLLSIAGDFFESVDADDLALGEPDDVRLLGSLASYNYSGYSDLDVHVMLDFGRRWTPREVPMMKRYFAMCKSMWNETHPSLEVAGYPVEMYVQDMSEPNAANGIYSLATGKWVRKPVPMEGGRIDAVLVRKKAADAISQVEFLERRAAGTGGAEAAGLMASAKVLKDRIVSGRREALASGLGELCTQNIVFKVLRRSGHLGRLDALVRRLYDASRSFENYTS